MISTSISMMSVILGIFIYAAGEGKIEYFKYATYSLLGIINVYFIVLMIYNILKGFSTKL